MYTGCLKMKSLCAEGWQSLCRKNVVEQSPIICTVFIFCEFQKLSPGELIISDCD